MISVSRATSVFGINTRTCSSVGSVDYASVSNVDGTGSGRFDVHYAVSFPFQERSARVLGVFFACSVIGTRADLCIHWKGEG